MPPRPDPEAPNLSRARILAAARQVVAEDGSPSLSMRRLAQELDVWPMGLYRYFQDKEALLDALAETVAASVPTPAATGPWRPRMTELLIALRDVLVAQPSDLRSRFAARAFAPGSLPVSEAGLRILLDAGFEAEAAGETWIALLAYTVGFASTRPDGAPGAGPRQVRAAIAALPEEDFPALAAVGDELETKVGSDRAFLSGLERLLSDRAAAR